ncbi:MAG: hypothetical protein IPK63_16535 [Candidatus Competibacteraceae bacterium]|nr:hypothetical protein [Candidatus Competibacteraceae bacterium]
MVWRSGPSITPLPRSKPDPAAAACWRSGDAAAFISVATALVRDRGVLAAMGRCPTGGTRSGQRTDFTTVWSLARERDCPGETHARPSLAQSDVSSLYRHGPLATPDRRELAWCLRSQLVIRHRPGTRHLRWSTGMAFW